MATNLIKPDARSIANPDQLLVMQLRVWEALSELQAAAARSTVIDLGAVTTDPGAPPSGKVYVYTIAGSYYARTATASYQLAL